MIFSLYQLLTVLLLSLYLSKMADYLSVHTARPAETPDHPQNMPGVVSLWKKNKVIDILTSFDNFIWHFNTSHSKLQIFISHGGAYLCKVSRYEKLLKRTNAMHRFNKHRQLAQCAIVLSFLCHG